MACIEYPPDLKEALESLASERRLTLEEATVFCLECGLRLLQLEEHDRDLALRYVSLLGSGDHRDLKFVIKAALDAYAMDT